MPPLVLFIFILNIYYKGFPDKDQSINVIK